MAGKFMSRSAMVSTERLLDRTNAIRKRSELTKHPISTHACGCPDEGCGAFHLIATDRVIPTDAGCAELLRQDNKQRRKPARKAKS